jgi:hypothetical protein
MFDEPDDLSVPEDEPGLGEGDGLDADDTLDTTGAPPGSDALAGSGLDADVGGDGPEAEADEPNPIADARDPDVGSLGDLLDVGSVAFGTGPLHEMPGPLGPLHDGPRPLPLGASPPIPLRAVDRPSSTVLAMPRPTQSRYPPGTSAGTGTLARSPSPATPQRREEPARLIVHSLPAEDVVKLIDEFGYSGMLLKIVRERLGLRISDIADHTRISVRYLEALEAEDGESLPSATFVRGYVREVARMLHLDPDAVVTGFMRRLG